MAYGLILYVLARGVVRGVRTWAALAMLAFFIVSLISSSMGAFERRGAIGFAIVDAALIWGAAISFTATRAYRRMVGSKGKPTDNLSTGHGGFWNLAGIALGLLLIVFAIQAAGQTPDPTTDAVAGALENPEVSEPVRSPTASPPRPVAADMRPIAPNEVPVFIGVLSEDGGDSLGRLLLDRVDQVVGLKVEADAETHSPSDGLLSLHSGPGEEGGTAIELNIAEDQVEFRSGAYHVDGFFVVKSAGMTQGTFILTLEPTDEAAIRTNPSLTVVDRMF